MKITLKQIEKLKNELQKKDIPRCNYKNRPIGCPMYGNMNIELQKNFNKEELQKAFILGLIGNENRIGKIIKNPKI